MLQQKSMCNFFFFIVKNEAIVKNGESDIFCLLTNLLIKSLNVKVNNSISFISW